MIKNKLVCRFKERKGAMYTKTYSRNITLSKLWKLPKVHKLVRVRWFRGNGIEAAPQGTQLPGFTVIQYGRQSHNIL